MATIGHSGKLLPGPVVVGDDDVEAQFLGARDLFHRSDAAVDRQDEAAPFGG